MTMSRALSLAYSCQESGSSERVDQSQHMQSLLMYALGERSISCRIKFQVPSGDPRMGRALLLGLLQICLAGKRVNTRSLVPKVI